MVLNYLELDVNLNVFVPFWNLNCGTGVPKDHGRRMILLNHLQYQILILYLILLQLLHLLLPTNFIPVSIYPKNLPCASSTKPAISIFKTVDDAEYKTW